MANGPDCLPGRVGGWAGDSGRLWDLLRGF